MLIFGESSENKIGQEINPNLYRKMLTDYNDAYQKGDLETAEKAVTEYYSKLDRKDQQQDQDQNLKMRKVLQLKKLNQQFLLVRYLKKQLLLQRVRLLIFHLHRVVLLIF